MDILHVIAHYRCNRRKIVPIEKILMCHEVRVCNQTKFTIPLKQTQIGIGVHFGVGPLVRLMWKCIVWNLWNCVEFGMCGMWNCVEF